MDRLYRQVERTIRQHEEYLNVGNSVTETEVRHAIRWVMRDNPNIFWFVHQYHYDKDNGIVSFGYRCSPERCAIIQKSIDDVVVNDFKIDHAHTLTQLEQVAYVYKLNYLYNKKLIKMTTNKEEFKSMVMLYSANIDGNIRPEEVEIMLERADSSTFKKTRQLFKKMGDAEVLDYIRDYKKHFVTTDEEKSQLMKDFRSVIESDEHCSQMEKYLYKAIEKLIGDE